MTDPEHRIHPPFRRLHAVMYLVSAAAIAAPVILITWALTDPISAERRSDLLVGYGVITAMSLVGLAIYWLAYLGHQRTAYVRTTEIVFRPWISFAGFGKERAVSLKEVQHALLLRPHYVEFTIPSAETRVGTFWHLLKGKDRVGTFWWRHEDYLAFARTLDALGIANEYRHIPGIGTLLTSW